MYIGFGRVGLGSPFFYCLFFMNFCNLKCTLWVFTPVEILTLNLLYLYSIGFEGTFESLARHL